MAKPRRDARRRPRGRQGWTGRFWKIGVVGGAVVLSVLGLRAAGVFEPGAANIDLNAGPYRVAAGETVGTKVSNQGSAHISDGQRFTYNTTPPTSGPHWQRPASWGIKDSQDANERTTHNLEHGGVIIAYSPTLASADVTKLKSLVRSVSGTYGKVILEPYADLTDAKIALAAWTWILKLPEYDEVQILKFMKAHYQSSDAPEPNAP